MTVLLALLVVGAGSLLFRLTPLLGASLLPDALTRAAGWGGLSALTAMTVRAVVEHADPAVPGAPLLAAVCVGTGLVVAYRGGSLPVSVAAGAATYLVLAAAVAVLS